MSLMISIAISPCALQQMVDSGPPPIITINVDFSDNTNSALIAALGI